MLQTIIQPIGQTQPGMSATGSASTNPFIYLALALLTVLAGVGLQRYGKRPDCA